MPTDVIYAYLGNITKSRDAEGFLHIKGIATDDSLDLDQQRCDPTWLNEAMPKWFKKGNIREMHQLSAVGKATKMTQNGTGFEIEAKIVDPAAALKFEEGVYTGLSIGIKGARVDLSSAAIQKAPKGVICGGDVIEVSGVDRSSNLNADVELVKTVNGELIKTDALGVVTDDNQVPCETCDGFGQVMLTEGMGVCPDCSGSGNGSVDIRPSDNGGDKTDGEVGKAGDPDCKTCGGKGTIRDGNMDCPDCVQKAAGYSTDYFGWTDLDKAAWTPFQKSLYPDSVKKDYSDKDRKAMASNGQALPGGGFPIRTVQDLKNAIQAIGLAKDPDAAKAHIKARAKALGQEALIPDSWKSAIAPLVKTLTSISKGADGDTWMHDPALLAQVRDGLVACTIAELNEFAEGDDERYDIDQLTSALNTFLSWWQGESFEGETSSPFSGDAMSFVGLGVEPDVIKAASAQTATPEDKSALRAQTLKALGLEGVESTVEQIKADLETVKRFAAPNTISKRAMEYQSEKAREVESLLAQANTLKAAAASFSDGTTKSQYREEERKLRERAASITRTFEGE